MNQKRHRRAPTTKTHATKREGRKERGTAAARASSSSSLSSFDRARQRVAACERNLLSAHCSPIRLASWPPRGHYRPLQFKALQRQPSKTCQTWPGRIHLSIYFWPFWKRPIGVKWGTPRGDTVHGKSFKIGKMYIYRNSYRDDVPNVKMCISNARVQRQTKCLRSILIICTQH